MAFGQQSKQDTAVALKLFYRKEYDVDPRYTKWTTLHNKTGFIRLLVCIETSSIYTFI